jgi:hypothetical protein
MRILLGLTFLAMVLAAVPARAVYSLGYAYQLEGGSFTPPDGVAASYTTGLHTLKVTDTTGELFAALVTLGRAQGARMSAEQQAAREAEKKGYGTGTATYQEAEPHPGSLFELWLVYGTATPKGVASSDADPLVVGGLMRLGLAEWHPVSDALDLGLTWGGRVVSYGGVIDFALADIGLQLGGAVPGVANLYVAGIAHAYPISAAIQLAKKKDWHEGGVGLKATYTPIEHLQVFAEADMDRVIVEKDKVLSKASVQLGVAFVWGYGDDDGDDNDDA